MRFFRPCFLSRLLYSRALFRIKTSGKVLCLTFDDGPDPGSTPLILDILDYYKIKAIFFCCGNAVEKYPYLSESIRKRGHLTGNHGYDHLNGWITSSERYINDVKRAAEDTSSHLFRPPYGRIDPISYKKLSRSYTIFFWDIMAYDFDRDFGAAGSLEILKKKIRPGSVIVLHDTPGSTCRYFLEDFIKISQERGYSFILPA